MTHPWRERVEIAGGRAVLYLGDNRDIWPTLPRPDAIVTDPPYPNGAAHFVDAVGGVREWLATGPSDQALLFWSETEIPFYPAPLCAVHVWHRSNTNRPDNYEPIFHFSSDGRKRASRCVAFPVVSVGLTGCHEATGHPTQKPVALMSWCLDQAKVAPGALVADPYMGSGTTGVACMRRGCRFVGIEIDEGYFRIAGRRIAEAARQPDLLIPETAA